ncbi:MULTISPECIES: hypothetical protein [Tenacibaculum]|uniref:hypothetical protein n=1 Tax=Tenacibaculum TaxID=104267 RepID=UPI0021AF18CB|nr:MULTISPECIES: hypothetical protein [Tenacibaculum]MCT4698683.1 hypothetical protein [Tenacibaculum haliotis]WBX72210.1 hypothetical protein PG912_05560 [Tenacibaculum retecalamus]
MSQKFIELHLKNHIISHGYDENNEEITVEVIAENFSPKTIAVSRIKSLSDKYILTDYIEGRWIYWEYKESYESVKNQLLKQL